MDRSNTDIMELSTAELDHVSGGSLLGTLLRPSMKYLAKIRIENAIKVIEQAGEQIVDSVKK
jgi:hypothetical protein